MKFAILLMSSCSVFLIICVVSSSSCFSCFFMMKCVGGVLFIAPLDSREWMENDDVGGKKAAGGAVLGGGCCGRLVGGLLVGCMGWEGGV